MSTFISGTPTDLSARVRASIGNWQRKLLDLSKRNRALNFKPSKVSTIAVVDEQPAEVFRHLYLQEAAMRFRPSESATATKAAPRDENLFSMSVEVNGEALDFESESEQGLDYVPYDPHAVDSKHRDEWLQTALAPDRLDHSLRRIDEQARSAFEEQGVNTLFLTLGMLRYRESSDSDVWLRAPLVLLPVTLSRKSARAGYSIVAGEEDALVNPALVEYVRTSYGVTLPDLPDAESMAETYDLQSFLKGTSEAVAAQSGWSVQTDMYLGLFSFQKLVMFKDLEVNAAAVGKHRLINQLLSRAGSSVHGLPQDIRELPLDSAFAPEATFQVVDADSSQMRAAAAVVKGHDVVIEGPPGTGKSQTITNLIAQALAAGKSVLFVAEKMAALEVVHRRLVSAGLGEFCLEVHSSKANKRSVMKELSVALDASLQSVSHATVAGRRLPEVRNTLAEYVKAVHDPLGPLAKSPYYVAGELGLLLQAPKSKLERDISTVTAEELAITERALKDLETHAAAVGDPVRHPWRDTGKTLYTEDDLETVESVARTVHVGADALSRQASLAANTFGLPAPTTLSDVAALKDVADVLAASPGVPSSVLQSEIWNQPPQEAVTLLNTLRRQQQLRQALSKKFNDDALSATHGDDVAYVERKASGMFGFLAFLDGRFRTIKRRWAAYRQPAYSVSLLEQAADLRQVEQLSSLSRELDAAVSTGKELFAGLWQGASSDVAKLDAYIAYVQRYRQLALSRTLGPETARAAERAQPDVSQLHALIKAGEELTSRLADLQQTVAWPSAYLREAPIIEIGAHARALAESVKRAPAWAAFEGSRQRAATTIASETVEAAMSGRLPIDQLTSAFLRSFYMKWMSAAIHARPALHRFDTLAHEALVREFRDLDQRVLRENRAALTGMLRERAQHKLRDPDAAAALPRLRREMVKQRRLSPLRKTLQECNAAVRAIKPCFMMSPLTVAQFVDGKQPTFDVVIFDEASQLPTEDAVGAIIRGNQLVVVGDPKQLPPTNFFSVTAGGTVAPLDEDGTPLYEDSESVLEEFMGAAVPMCRLKWHYRSAHESLISFSNVNFYDADLHTFPSVVTNTDAAGLQFTYVDGGVYEGKGINLVEARRIADDVVLFATVQLAREAAGERPLSLGVGTLNLRQQVGILDELEVRRRQDPSVEPFFDRSRDEPFFVKNLENIQGDERDAIFLSITYGKSNDGRLRYNFGPLNRENGWRRLNVLVTRARRQMKVFSSIRDHDINPAGVTSDGPKLLRDFLSYAEHRRLANAALTAASETESPFERDVCLELTRRGIRVEPQVGVCGYRVDLGILDDELPGRFVCGIECDGVGYHSMETVRDRDRLRQQVLEDRGWIIHRVWSTDWFKDRAGQIERLLALIQQSREQIKSEAIQRHDKKTATARVSEVEQSQEQEVAVPTMQPRAPGEYRRPSLPDYKVFSAKKMRGELLDAPTDAVADVVSKVVELEGPVHEADVIARVCALWDTKAGSRIQSAIRAAVAVAQRAGRIQKKGPFLWRRDGSCQPRCRAHTDIPGDRIAPEEYTEAIALIVGSGFMVPRGELIAETRAVMGYSRTGVVLEAAIGSVIDALVLQGRLGEASSGLTLRTTTGGER